MSEMNEMNERVAAAIWPWVALMGKDRALGRGVAAEIAHAAIGAVREPTEAMLNAARDWSYQKYGKPIGNDAATGCWQAMIGAAPKNPTAV